MTTKFQAISKELLQAPKRWLVTGAAGFIGSHLVETLLNLNQQVVGLDNFATGRKANLKSLEDSIEGKLWKNFRFIEGDICDAKVVSEAVEGAQYILHQAALGSVPRSIEQPMNTHRANVEGFLSVALAARAPSVERMVYASSSSVYGDHPQLPKVEDVLGIPLSPYAASKRIDEVYASALAKSYKLSLVGLRYFNVFGPRQDPNGAYAAVIPRWIAELLTGTQCQINGDGQTSRDFCPVQNVVQANILAACVPSKIEESRVYNVALGGRTTLVELYEALAQAACDNAMMPKPLFKPERAGDVRHSLADISKITNELGFSPEVSFREAIHSTVQWYRNEGGATDS